MTEADLQRAETLATFFNVSRWAKWEQEQVTENTLKALVRRVRVLTDAGNQLADSVTDLLDEDAPETDPFAALTTWRNLTTDEGAE